MASREQRGSVRTAVVWDALEAALAGGPRDVVDLGGGTGGFAVRLAESGHHVRVVDPSPDALAALARRAQEVALDVTGIQGDVTDLVEVVGAGTADVVLCHGVLEVVDPALALARIGEVLRPGGLLSLVVGQRHAAVVARAMAGHFQQARGLLDGQEPLDARTGRRFTSGEPRGPARHGRLRAHHGARGPGLHRPGPGRSRRPRARCLRRARGAWSARSPGARSTCPWPPRCTCSPPGPDLAPPALVRPALVRPALVRPALVRPALVRPALVRPALVRPALVRPALVRPALVRPALVRPALVRPALVRPALVRPGLARLGCAGSGHAGPRSAGPVAGLTPGWTTPGRRGDPGRAEPRGGSP
ncbi:methyltransferase domain-containing protein [Nocardioides convexus]|uniref:class I SAM-dependent methyltransferase n=1 Tax=Nocardioides convexus TaxID=2712224 RepID=UPI0024183599|nr:methyltransferase domain-containing protein [Nocardioides convexus]